jgi:glycosyltransferase involved in cell wall biosynthesis
MAQGKAIVVSDIPSMREVAPEGTAIAVCPSNSRAFADTLVCLLRDQKAREDLGVRARRRAFETYRWEVITQQIVTAYEAILK